MLLKLRLSKLECEGTMGGRVAELHWCVKSCDVGLGSEKEEVTRDRWMAGSGRGSTLKLLLVTNFGTIRLEVVNSSA